MAWIVNRSFMSSIVDLHGFGRTFALTVRTGRRHVAACIGVHVAHGYEMSVSL